MSPSRGWVGIVLCFAVMPPSLAHAEPDAETDTGKPAEKEAAKKEPPKPPVVVSVAPPGKPIQLGGSVDLVAKVTGGPGDPSVTWSVEGSEGTVDAQGHFQAPASGKTPLSIKVKATSVADPKKSAVATVAIQAVAVSLQAPKSVAVGGEADVGLKVAGAPESANGVTWSAAGTNGAIDEKGHLKVASPLKTPASVVVKATSVADPSKSATATVEIPAVAVSIKPVKPMLLGGELDLEAKVTGVPESAAGVTWSVAGSDGSIDEKGHLKIAATLKTPASVVAKATSVADPSKSASVTVAIPAVAVSVKPAKPVLLGGETDLEAKVTGASDSAAGITWSVAGPNGTVDEKGHLKVAASLKTPASIVVKATSAADPSKSGSVTVAVAAVVVSLPAAKPLLVGGETDLVAKVAGVPENAAGVTWTVTGAAGTIDDKGHLKVASPLKTPASIAVKATSVADPSKSAATTVAIPAVMVAIQGAKPLQVGAETDLVAKLTGVPESAAGVTWSATGAGGTIDEKGHVKVASPLKTPASIAVKATSVADPSKSASTTIPVSAVAVSLKPPKPTQVGGELDLEAKVAGVSEAAAGVTWSATGNSGTVDDKGHLKVASPLKTPASIPVKATSVADPSKSVSAVVAVPAVTVSVKPPKPTLVGGEVDLEAKVTGAPESASGVTWSVVESAGSIDEKGHLKIASPLKTPATVAVKASSVADPSKTVSVSVAVPAVAVSIKPVKPVPTGGEIDLEAKVTGVPESAAGVTWNVTGSDGSIDEKGHLKVAASVKTPATIAVKATSVADPSKSAVVNVTVPAVNVSVKPVKAVPLGGETDLVASVTGARADAVGVTWSVVGGNGSIDEKGHFKAPATFKTPGTITVKATSVADSSRSASVAIAIPAIAVGAKPPGKPLVLGSSVDLVASVSGAEGDAKKLTWSVPEGQGSIDDAGHFTAPSTYKTPASITAKVVSAADSSKAASVTINIAAVVISVSPHAATVDLGGSTTFAASENGSAASPTWSVQGGKDQGEIDAQGRYSAPAHLRTPAHVTIKATSSGDPSKAVTAEVTIPAVAVSASPKSLSVQLGGTAKIEAHVAHAEGDAGKVTWSVVGGDAVGSVDADGTFHAPAIRPKANTVQVRATSVADSSQAATAEVRWDPVTIKVESDRAQVALGGTIHLTAHVEGSSETGVEWSVDGQGFGSISPDGSFQAPTTLPDPARVKVIARAKADPSRSASATIALTLSGAYSVAGDQRISGGQPGTLLAGAPSQQRVAIDDKRAIAVYSDGQALLVPVSEDRGITFKAPSRLLNDKGPIVAPALAIGPDHTLWVAFRSTNNSQPGDITVCRTPDLQHTFDPCVKVNGKTPVGVPREQVLAIAPKGEVFVAWIDAKSGSEQVVLASSTNRGVSWSLTPRSATAPQGLALSVGADGVPVLGWIEDGKKVHVVAGDHEREEPSFGGQVANLALAARDADHVLLAASSSGRVKAARLGESTVGSVGGDQGARQDFPALAFDGQAAQVVWREHRDSGEAIVLSRATDAFGSGSLSFDEARLASTPGPAARGAPSIALDSAGRATLVWPDGRAGDARGQHMDLYVARADEHPAHLTVTVPNKPLLAGQTAQFTAKVVGVTEAGVRWSVDDGAGRGSVTADGLYSQPPHLTGSPHIYVRATSVADPTRSAAALVELAPIPELRSFSPAACGVGETVTVEGEHFGERYPGFAVRFGGVPVQEADYVSWTGEKVVVRVPPSGKSGRIDLQASGGVATSASEFSFLPVVVTVQPPFAVIHQGQRKTFAGKVEHAGDTRVRWALEGDSEAGHLAADGTLTVDDHPSGVHRAVLQATSVADSTQSGSSQLITGPEGGRVWEAEAKSAHGPATDGHGHYVITSEDGTIQAFDSLGKDLWKQVVVNPLVAEGTPPVVRSPVASGDLVAVVVQNSGSCLNGRACQPDTGTVFAYHSADGSLAWKVELGDGDFSDAVATPKGLAVARYAGTVTAFDLDGKKLWAATLPKGLATAPVLGADGLLHGSGAGGTVYALSLDGKQLYSTTLPEKPGTLSRPAVAADGSSFLTGDDGLLRALDAKGQVRWQAPLQGRVPPRTDPTPLVSVNGEVVAVSSSTVEVFSASGERKWSTPCAACSAPIVQGSDGLVYAGRHAPQGYRPDGKLAWAGEAPGEGERWTSGLLTAEGFLLWTDAHGVSALITSSVADSALPPAPAEASTTKSAKRTSPSSHQR